jgi:hypothetical protein
MEDGFTFTHAITTPYSGLVVIDATPSIKLTCMIKLIHY